MADGARGTTMVQTTRAWSRELERLHTRIAHRFQRAEPRRRSLAYLKALAASVERKNGWQMAEAVGDSTPDGMQRLLNQAEWNTDLVRDDLREYVVEHFADERAVLVCDETGFLKKGTKSVGVPATVLGDGGQEGELPDRRVPLLCF
jgi:SRSO17 transposase